MISSLRSHKTEFKEIKMIDLSEYPTSFLIEMIPHIKDELKRRKNVENVKKRMGFVKSLRPVPNSIFENNDEIIKYNSVNLLGLPNMNEPCFSRRKYLKSLLDQNWSHLYPPTGNTDSDFYVYVHTDPSDKVFVTSDDCGGNYGGLPFYVGKGRGNRAYDLKRNQGHGKKIKDVLSKGFDKDDIVKIVFSGLTEERAFEIESKLIYFFGTIYEREQGSSLYNLDIPKRPEYLSCMRKLRTKKQFELSKGV